MRNVVLVFVFAAAAGAQPLPSLVEEALRGNREILAAQKKYEAARQRPTQQSSMPEPTVSLGYASSGSPRPFAGLGSSAMANAGVMVSQEVPFPGKLKLRGEIAAKEADAEFQQYLAVRRSVTMRLKEAYHELHHAMVSVASVKRSQQLLQNFIRISEARYSVGKAAQQDVFRAQAQFSIFEAQLQRYEQQRQSKQIEIAALLNRPAGSGIEVPEDIPAGELRVTLEQVLAHAHAQSPMLLREQKMVQRTELAANLARKDYYPDYTLSGGYYNQGSMPPMYEFRVDVKVPVYFWRKQRAAVAEQAFAASEARHTYESVEKEIDARTRDLYLNAQTARRLMDLYAKAVVPQARLALESSMASYETGSLDFLPLFTNFMTVVEYDLMYHEEMMKFHIALARLEEMTGMELEP
jgi:outer membrane protein, heavy metal efflux system